MQAAQTGTRTAITSNRWSEGFTVIELMVTITVAAILVAVAVPSFTSFTRNMRLTGQTNSLVYSLNYARSEAVKLDSANGVSVCASTDQQTCNNPGSWATGWIVLTNATVTLPATVLQVVPALAAGNTLTEKSANLKKVTFLPNGGASSTMSFNLCDSRGGSYARDVEVNAMGRIQSSPQPGLSVGPPSVALTCP